MLQARLSLICIALVVALAVLRPQVVSAQSQVSVPWTVICAFENRVAQDPADKCRMAQSLVTGETADPVLVVRVFPEPQPLMLASVPLNVFLKPGLSMQIDSKRAETYGFEICNEEGCHVGVPLDADKLSALKRGLFARFTYRDATGLDITLPVDLSGFTASWEALQDALE